MYTVFEGSGFTTPKRNRIGLVVFVRTLAEARAHMDPGDKVVRWNKWGHGSKVWRKDSDGKVRAIG